MLTSSRRLLRRRRTIRRLWPIRDGLLARAAAEDAGEDLGDARGSPSSSSSSSSSRPRVDLLSALAGAAFNRVASLGSSAMEMPGTVARTVSRVMEPMPDGFPPGPSGDAAIELGADPLAFITKTQLEHGDVVGRG